MWDRVSRLGLVIVVCSGLLATTIMRIAVWQDARALWADAAARDPALSRPWVQLGAIDMQDGRVGDAAAAFHQAIHAASQPSRSPIEQSAARAFAELNLGILASAAGDRPSADAWTRLALARAPSNARLQEAAAWLARQ